MAEHEEQNVLEQKSYVLIEFKDVASVELRVLTNNVTPLQILAVASYLDVMGKSRLIEQENERMSREAKLAVPENKIIIPGR
jgi:hypothetical protein